MSQKKAKLQRKANQMAEQKAQFSFEQIEHLVGLTELLTGEKPKEIKVTKLYYDWYVQSCQRYADTLGLNLGFQDGPQFNGVKIVSNEPTVTTAKK